MASKTLSERFQNKYRTAHNGCWLWQHAGYGWLRYGGRMQLAHRKEFAAGAADCSALAKRFGCSYWVVWNVVRGRTWKDLDRKDPGRAE